MGMDCNGYILVRVPNAQDLAWYEEKGSETIPESAGLRVEQLSLTPEEHAELNQMFGQAFPGEPRQFINTTKLEEDFKIPAHYNFDFNAFDLSKEDGWVQYHSSKEGEHSMLLEVKSAAYLYTDGLFHVLAVVEKAGYLRKPFRKDFDTPTSRVEGDTLVLTSGNFAGADEVAINTLLGFDTAERYCRTLLPSNIELARALRTHAGDPKAWDANVIAVLENPLGIVCLDW